MRVKVLYEDGQVIVLDKPSGVVVNRAETVKEKTMQDWIEENFDYLKKEKNETFVKRSGIVHRIDKGTSGCLLAAKNAESFKNLQEQFKKRKVGKEYMALTHGRIVSREGKIKAPIARSSWDREKFAVVPDGRRSITAYRVEKYYQKEDEVLTEIRAFPKTGRTHQIRVHFQYLGHPLVADRKYAGEKRYKKDKIWCPRIFLHAGRIRFKHPLGNKIVDVKSSLPPELLGALSNLKEIWSPTCKHVVFLVSG